MLIAKCYLDLLVVGDMFKVFLINGVLKVDYSKLSDFEINRLVAEKLGLKTNHKDGVSKYKDSPNGFMIVTREPFQHYPFDPCNDAKKAWPIILDNEISLIRDVSTNDVWEALVKGWFTVDGFESSIGNKLCHINKNPLRAAMIVFLMMQDDKK